jgi:hypothetical protein
MLMSGPGICSVASITSNTNLCSWVIRAMSSTTPADSRVGVKTSWRPCRILSVRGRGRGDWMIDCTRFGLFLQIWISSTASSHMFAFQVLRPDGQSSAITRVEAFREYLPR